MAALLSSAIDQTLPFERRHHPEPLCCAIRKSDLNTRRIWLRHDAESLAGRAEKAGPVS